MQIIPYEDKYYQQVVELILGIQKAEFGLSLTAADQPDLQNIGSFYQQGKGNFWIAEENGIVAGTIALIDFGNNNTALRKMFVDRGYRGKEKKIAAQLMDQLLDWCRHKNVKGVYLGTIDVMKAAHRFYEKNGFTRLPRHELPADFPVMAVDNVFYQRAVNAHPTD